MKLRLAAAALVIACSANATPSVVRTPAGAATALALSTPRAVHTATKLLDGRVVIAGGFGVGGRNESSLEIFDPARGEFASLGAMRTVRYGHTATLLRDGRVLFVGGYDGSGERQASAEIFDPFTGRTSPTGAPLVARADQSAVTLLDGRVLIAGGTGAGTSFLASAEIFDTATGSFTAAGPMSVPRESATMTRLRDGRVLITGGHAGRQSALVVYASAEIFDPATSTFTSTLSMTVRRHKHDAVLLADGSVLVVGGSDERDDRGEYATAERFDPATGTFSPAAGLALARYKLRETTLLLGDGRVLITTGADRPELYTPGRGSTPLAMSFGRSPLFATATLLNDGRVLVTGGYLLTGPASRDAWLLVIP